jgi:DNA mismatch repair protein MutL
MPGIRILPDHVANQIAAGEVVERPAAVVKELVENALDAGATRVEVEFRSAGRALMRVEDNGRGMGREDALLAFERHATSKITEASDLDRLTTFGFRGEALPSIASVSRCTLQTRVAGAPEGTEVLFNGGKFVHERACGRAVGTSVEVAHLFQPVPARRKFLKSDRTEAAHIVHCVQLYALAFPGVAFSLAEDGRVVFRSPSCASLDERIAGIFGPQAAGDLTPLASEEPGLRLSGLIGRPGAARASRHEMVTFVNSRPVDSRALSYALMESYQQSIPKGKYPAAFIFLECNPAAVDVNVHPAKREVRFRDEAAVRGFVIRSVLGCLREVSAAVAPRAALPAAPGVPRPPPVMELREPAPPAPGPSPAAVPDKPAAPGQGAPAGPAWRFIGLAHANLALFETPAGVMLVDRRAAHERIWYERLRASFGAAQGQGQRLLVPVPVQLDAIASAMLLDWRAALGAMGLEIAGFGRNFFRIESVPAWMEPGEAEPFVREVLGAAREGRLNARDPDLARDELARLATARASRLPATAGPAEMQALVAALFSTRSPLASPSGRPTCIELGLAELAGRFGR